MAHWNGLTDNSHDGPHKRALFTFTPNELLYLADAVGGALEDVGEVTATEGLALARMLDTFESALDWLEDSDEEEG